MYNESAANNKVVWNVGTMSCIGWEPLSKFVSLTLGSKYEHVLIIDKISFLSFTEHD